MTTVLRIARHTDLVTRRPTLDAYRKRNEARPAFQRALAAQMTTFAKHAPRAR
jgi:glutathione S-transferase